MSGFDYLNNALHLEDHIAEADLIITGEGKLDQQSLSGKVVGSIAELCQKHKKAVITIVGTNELSQTEISTTGISKVYTIMDIANSQEDAMKHVQGYLREIVTIFLKSHGLLLYNL